MTPQEFVSSLKRTVLDDQMRHYLRCLAELHTSSSDRTAWPRVSKTYQNLSDEEKRALERALRQVIVDTLSSVFGILDGTTLLDRYREKFHLKYDEDGRELNGDLQDLFLAGET